MNLDEARVFERPERLAHCRSADIEPLSQFALGRKLLTYIYALGKDQILNLRNYELCEIPLFDGRERAANKLVQYGLTSNLYGENDDTASEGCQENKCI